MKMEERRHALSRFLHWFGPQGQSAVLLSCWIAQLASLALSWPLWRARSLPPNLPVLDELPAWSMGWPLVLSLALVPASPRAGTLVHAAILVLACVLDQTRMQPQTMCLALLMLLTAFDQWRWLARWFLGSLWFWAGVHKLLSPDWHGQQAWELSALLLLPWTESQCVVALGVAGYEVALGVLALMRRPIAVWMCVLMHGSIAILLSPAWAAWNYEVIPWNMAMAIAGAWLLANDAAPSSVRDPKQSTSLWPQWMVAGLLLIYPIGFYVGWVDHYLAFVLYSDNLPRGVITAADSCWEIQTPELGCAFPNERRLVRQYFAKAGQAGWKLHLTDPRAWLPDEYWLHTGTGITQVTRAEFLSGRAVRGVRTEAGVLSDDRRAVFALAQAGARLLKRKTDAMVYAVELPAAQFKPELLQLLAGVPNLEQLQLRDCPVDDRLLGQLPELRRLKIIGLEGTRVSPAMVQRWQGF